MKKIISTHFMMALLLLLASANQVAAQIWSEDFDGGLGAWTQIDNSSQTSGDAWIHTTIGPAGTFFIDPLASTSAANGWALFDSDLLCSHSQNAWLVSPTINLSAEPEVHLFFEQFYRRYLDSTYVQVSTDDGATWTAFQINGGLSDNDFNTENGETVELDLSDLAGGEATVKIAFQFLSDDQSNAANTGCGYSWQIDDIRLEDEGSGGPSGDPNILWGGPGDPDSEFAGGLNGWTAVGITYPGANWVWEADGKADMGAFATGTGSLGIQSPSLANGAMVFDSDFYDNDGDDSNLGGGAFPANQVGELISPVMDLAGAGALSLKFNQYHRNFQSTTSIAWSMDGGNSWSDPIIVNDDVAVNAQTTRNNIQVVPLKGATGTNQFRVKFIIDGNYYFWIVDDVWVLKREGNNMQVNSNFYAIAPNFRTPVSQREEFGFLADIENVGGNEQTNVNLNIEITNNAGGATVYTEDNFYGNVPADSIVENVSFGGFTPPNAVADYTGVYTITSDSVDMDLTNNSLQFRFEVSDSTFSKDRQRTRNIIPAESNWDAGEAHSWAYGNYYFVPNGSGFSATSCAFGIANAGELQGLQLSLKLYAWDDTDDDGDADPDERTIVGINLYDIIGNENNVAVLKAPLFDFSFEDAPVLDDNTAYLMMIEFEAPDDQTDYLMHASDEYDYGAMVLNSEQMGAPRYAAMLGINEPLDDEAYSSLGFGRDLVPVVRLNVNETPSATNQLSADNLIELFPNPTSDLLNVNVKLVEHTQNFRMSLVDMSGKVVFRQDYDNVQSEQLQIDLKGLAAGQYAAFISTDNGTAVRKFAVQK